MNDFSINQIVNGKHAGTFVILGFRKIQNEDWVQLKEVNPDNHSETGPGELALPLSLIKAI